jgi:hypothetical protein
MLFLFNFTPAQEAEYVPGLIQVKFKKGAVTKLDSKISLNSVKNIVLKKYLVNVGFKESRKIFSNVVEDDTIGIDSEGKTFKKNDLSRWYLISFDEKNDVNSVKENILKQNDIEFACPVTKWEINFEPDDPYFQSGYQSGLKNGSTGRDIHATQAWDYNIGRSDVKIAVVDAGVDYNHIDLDPGNRSRIIGGYDAADGDYNPIDDIPSQYKAASHGTKVAGVIGAITNNDEGVAGIMHNLKIIPVKVFATNGPWWDPFSWTAGSAIDPWIADGINYASNNGAKVINLSLGGYGLPQWLTIFIGNPVGEAVYNAYHQGVVIVGAAGNDNTDDLHFPSAFPGVIGVSAVNNNDVKTSFSNYGSYISVCAPGNYDENYSTKRGNQYDYFEGTSCSAPMVSGSAGLIISEALDRGISLNNDDVKHLLEASADKVPGMQGQVWHEYYGYGRINVGRALERLNPPYTVTTQTVYNSSGQLVWDSHPHQFYNNAGLASGNYYGVKQYKVSGHVTFPTAYTSTPYVWVRERECIGWNYADPNLELPWVNITNVTTTGFDYETVIYWIGYDLLGQQINKYWPGNSSTLQAKISYTAIGVPLVAPVISSLTQNPEPICQGSYGYVYCNLSQGNGTLTYNWSASDLPAGAYITPMGNKCKVTYSYSSLAKDGGTNQIMAPLAQIYCTVSNSAGSDNDSMTPSFSTNCGGCPTLAFEENGLIENENPILTKSVISQEDVTDYYLIQNELNKIDKEIKFIIHEPEEEHTYLDQIELLEVKVNPNEYVAVTEKGEVISYKLSKKGIEFINGNKDDLENSLSSIDDNVTDFSSGDSLIINSESLSMSSNNEDMYLLFVGIKPPIKEQSVAELTTSELDKSAESTQLYARPNKSVFGVKLGKKLSNTMKIKFHQDVEVDFISIVKNEKTAKVDKLKLIEAVHSENGKVIEQLSAVDEKYSEILPGEKISFVFESKNNTDEKVSYILKSVGRYEEAGLYKNSSESKTNETVSVPTETKLIGNYPNPFNPTTQISYQLKEAAEVTIKIYDVLGKEVKTLVDGFKEEGYHQVSFDASSLSSGIYFYTMKTKEKYDIKKMLLVR